MEWTLNNGEKILFIGDSITDCGRRGQFSPLGNGYVSLFSQLVTAAHPKWKIEYVNKGIGGNKVTDLKNRWKDDVIDQDFDHLSIMIGINDLASFIRSDPASVDPELFHQTYDGILEYTLDEHDCGILLLDPFYISRDHGGNSIRSEFLRLIPEYTGTVTTISSKYDTKHIETQELFSRHLKYREPDSFAPEPVHPYQLGHLIIAHSIFKELIGGSL